MTVMLFSCAFALSTALYAGWERLRGEIEAREERRAAERLRAMGPPVLGGAGRTRPPVPRQAFGRRRALHRPAQVQRGWQ